MKLRDTIGIIGALATMAAANAASISVNFGINLNDANAIDTGETAFVGLAGAEAGGTVANVLLHPGTSPGTPTSFTAATQGGNSLTVGGGISMTSTGSFFSNFANVSSPNQSATGDGGLFQSMLLMNDGETISLSGLSTFAPLGFKVIAVFDDGASFDRTYGLTDGTTAYWTADTGNDNDSDNDGTITWTQTTATTQGTATVRANYAEWSGTGDTFSLSGANSTRAALNGFHIVAIPEPSAGVLLGTLVMFGITRRRR